MPGPNQRRNLRIIGLLTIAVVALIAVFLISMDTAEQDPTSQDVRPVPTENLEEGETEASPTNETPVADPSGPYQPQ